MNIYIWNAKKLAEDLRRGATTEVEKMRYLLILTLVYMVISYEALFVGEAYTLIYTLDWLAFVVISVLGIIYCFRQNEKGDNSDFIARFTCLALPAGVRFLVYSIPATIVFYGVLYGLLTEEQVLSYGSIAEAVFFNVLGIAFYYLLGSYITLTARPGSSS